MTMRISLDYWMTDPSLREQIKAAIEFLKTNPKFKVTLPNCVWVDNELFGISLYWTSKGPKVWVQGHINCIDITRKIQEYIK